MEAQSKKLKQLELSPSLQDNQNLYSENPEYKYSKCKNFLFAKRDKNKPWQIVFAGEVCSEKTFKTTKEAEAFINEKPWNLIATVAMICAGVYNKNNKNK